MFSVRQASRQASPSPCSTPAVAGSSPGVALPQAVARHANTAIHPIFSSVIVSSSTSICTRCRGGGYDERKTRTVGPARSSSVCPSHATMIMRRTLTGPELPAPARAVRCDRAGGQLHFVYNMHMQPMIRSRLRDDIADRIATLIVDGELADRLKEVELASQLGVSRTPLREALLMLEREGLVVSEVNKGFRVAALSESRVRELYPILGTLEGLAVRESGERLRARAGDLRAVNAALR